MNFSLNLRSPLAITLAHVLLGIMMTFPLFPKLYCALIIIVGVISIYKNKNANHEALLFSCYLVGSEVLLRMTSGVLLYEIGKYGVIIFLFLGSWHGKNTNKPNVFFLLYLLLLLIGIAFTSLPDGASYRKEIAFNLSGPFLLGICALYFYRRRISLNTIFIALKYMALPIISMSTYLYFKTPDVREIAFGGAANFAASGGFGPNQVATSLGLGAFCLAILIFARRSLSGYLALDIFFLFYLIYRGLLTFSRGGVYTAIIAIMIFILFYSIYIRMRSIDYLKLIGVGFILIISVIFYTSDATGGMLYNRYTGKNASGIQKEDISSGRLDIINEQLNSFYDNPIFGIGVGNGKHKRKNSLKRVTNISHNEIGRLIEEHGLVGILSLVLLLISPFFIFISAGNLEKAFLVSFFFIWFLTINHSAMRIALPSLMYGLSLIKIEDDE